jgi:hypothetical protein
MLRTRTIIASTAIAVVTAGGAVAVAVAGAATIPIAAPTASASAVFREFEGTITSVNASNRSFRIRDHERGTFRVFVTRATRYERVAGFSALRRGLGEIEVSVRRTDGRWVAREIERDDDRGGRSGHDDRSGRSGRDDRSDDHGGRSGRDDHGGGRGRDHAEDD